jgi:phosphonate transport system substrate-binding protein
MLRVAAAITLFALSLGSAGAAWRDELKVLRVGFLAGDNPAYGVATMEKFRWELQKSLALPVELFPARSYQALIEAEASGRIQYAVLSSLAFIALDQDCHCGEPLVQPLAGNEARGFRAMLVTRNDGAITSLETAKGSRLAVGRKDSISGRIAPLAGLAGEGIEADGYFARVIENDDNFAALESLQAGASDVAVAWSTATDPLSIEPGSGPIADLAASGAVNPTDLRVLWLSDWIPFGPHVVRKDLPAEAKSALLDALLAMHQTAPEAYDAVEHQFSGGFVEADPLAYRRLAAVIAEAAAPQ